MSEGLEALSQALNDAREQEQRDEAEQRRADVKARAKGFVQKFKARRESYAHLQQASTAFLEALRNHLTGGALLRTEAVSVAGHGGMISIPDVAGGVARADALALATTLREAIVMFGQPRLMSQYIAVNDFAKPVSFVEAHEANAALVGRLA
ncbi:MAG: hypothetical protein ABI605_16740 [Rhizobacter sp.]